jgi:hypothetical protein
MRYIFDGLTDAKLIAETEGSERAAADALREAAGFRRLVSITHLKMSFHCSRDPHVTE